MVYQDKRRRGAYSKRLHENHGGIAVEECGLLFRIAKPANQVKTTHTHTKLDLIAQKEEEEEGGNTQLTDGKEL
jgi:hypothetical protein